MYVCTHVCVYTCVYVSVLHRHSHSRCEREDVSSEGWYMCYVLCACIGACMCVMYVCTHVCMCFTQERTSVKDGLCFEGESLLCRMQ